MGGGVCGGERCVCGGEGCVWDGGRCVWGGAGGRCVRGEEGVCVLAYMFVSLHVCLYYISFIISIHKPCICGQMKSLNLLSSRRQLLVLLTLSRALEKPCLLPALRD